MTRLASFLEDRARPAGTLRYHALQGFLFAVASPRSTHVFPGAIYVRYMA